MTAIGDAILTLLRQRNIAFQQLSHPAAVSCEQSAAFRGQSQQIGAKSLLFKSKHGFAMFVLPAHRQIDSNKVRRLLQSQKLRFATESELMALAGVEKGALPPFGNGLLAIPMFLDERLQDNEILAFNCGVNTESVILAMTDYLSLVTAHWCDCVKAATPAEPAL